MTPQEMRDKARALRDEAAKLDELANKTEANNLGLVPSKTLVTSGGNIFLFSHVYLNLNGKKPWLKGYKIKKDGTPGARLQTIYDWEFAT